ncbi:hypothetical protein [Curtobacterium sp. VKM Ac-2922]|uniref:hypothetical protein n=1 Tax=Curtobacterium sp. VKM Ac-2922 TaxID=2929475 RepID=UPI001FB4ED61|nr:hypothetical protein [Curtobacterium sp. VKM Ac-2922]MCJ1715426.1 hypothetical protein [Curtobacterium sp. VKM Ac-2922]
MTRHVPWDPWPDPRWDALVIVGGLVFEVPVGWAASPTDGGVRLDRTDGVVSIGLSAVPDRPVELARRVLTTRPDAVLLESATDQILFALPEPADLVMVEHRCIDVGGTRVRIDLRCSVRDWPAVSEVVDGLLESRWSTRDTVHAVGLPELAAEVGPGPVLQWRTDAGVLDHLVRFRDRGVVPGGERRSEAGRSAREHGLVGRFGATTDKGDELVGPIRDPDAVLAVERNDPANPDVVHRWSCWVQGRRCVVRAEQPDGSTALGVVDVGSVAGHLLAWISPEPTGTIVGRGAVTISSAQLVDRSGPCPSDVAWFRAAWTAPTWQSVRGWSDAARSGFGWLSIGGVGVAEWSSTGDRVTLAPERPSSLVRQVATTTNGLATAAVRT